VKQDCQDYIFHRDFVCASKENALEVPETLDENPMGQITLAAVAEQDEAQKSIVFYHVTCHVLSCLIVEGSNWIGS